MTRYNLPLADDPSSIESLLRTRKSQLAAGRRVERATATAEHGRRRAASAHANHAAGPPPHRRRGRGPDRPRVPLPAGAPFGRRRPSVSLPVARVHDDALISTTPRDAAGPLRPRSSLSPSSTVSSAASSNVCPVGCVGRIQVVAVAFPRPMRRGSSSPCSHGSGSRCQPCKATQNGLKPCRPCAPLLRSAHGSRALGDVRGQ